MLKSSEVNNVPAGQHFELDILAPFTNERFPFNAIISGYLMSQAWGLPVQFQQKRLFKKCFITKLFDTFVPVNYRMMYS